MKYVYNAVLSNDPDGGFLVEFPDIPEALTHGNSREDALANAMEALGLALRGYAAKKLPLPEQRCAAGEVVPVDAGDALKLAVLEAFYAAGITKTELARRMGKAEAEARRILDADHPTKLAVLQQALRVLGRRVSIDVEAA